ncbi:MAG: hypothetical protein U0936_01475 [Planctomycetaceae bacterium]
MTKPALLNLRLRGGTPTFLSGRNWPSGGNLSEMGVDGQQVPVSVESPVTVDREKLSLLADFATDRISIGIQSFDEAENPSAGKTATQADVMNAQR